MMQTEDAWTRRPKGHIVKRHCAKLVAESRLILPAG